MSESSSYVCNIFDIPDEILVKIILHFNARERLVLAKSCTQFNNLVFGDEELLRDLDFTKNSCLITATDIQQYFSKETVCKLLRKVNVQNVKWMKEAHILNDSISRAINLVDINIHGTKFNDIEELGSFLEPLVHVKRLSIDWPELKKHDVAIYRKILQKPFSRLIYLSVKVYVYSKVFLPTVEVCQELEELRMMVTRPHDCLVRPNMSWCLESNKPRSLKIIQVRGIDWTKLEPLKQHLITMVPDPHEWTDFQMVDTFRRSGFYFEKNLEICEELRLKKLYHYQVYQHVMKFCAFLNSECLLSEVIRITHEDAPDKFCCLTPSMPRISGHVKLNEFEGSCLLKIDEAKRLLKDPGYQISFLHFKHSIESDCDAHLVASAFPNLTELVLTHIIKREGDGVSTLRKKEHSCRRLRRRGSMASEEQDDPTNVDSSFKMLIENTPHVRDLTIYGHNMENEGTAREGWDLDALYLIPLWKNLLILRLAFIRVRDEKILIHIGKECPQLEKIVLQDLGNPHDTWYSNDLSKMLNYCKNLKEFSMSRRNVASVSKLVESLSNNLKLRSVRLRDSITTYTQCTKLIPTIERLLHRCPELTTFVFLFDWRFKDDEDRLLSALRRIKVELNRPNFQFQIAVLPGQQDCTEEFDTVYEDASPTFFPCKMDGIHFT